MTYEQFQAAKRDITLALGNPFYETETCLLFCGDTLEMQRRLNYPLFQAVITSPPYNIGKEYEVRQTTEEYIDWIVRWAEGVSGMLTSCGTLLLNLGYTRVEGYGRAVPIPYLLWDKIPLFLNQEIIWNYSAGVACKNYLSPRNEKVLWYVKDKEHYTFNLDAIRDKNVKYPNSKKGGKLRVNTLGKNPSDVWEIAKVTTGHNRASKERTSHPCQFPTDLTDRLVLGFSNEGDLIMDPFMGSGTTFISCARYKRFCIGFEIRPDYCRIAKDRVENLTSQISFDDMEV